MSCGLRGTTSALGEFPLVVTVARRGGPVIEGVNRAVRLGTGLAGFDFGVETRVVVGLVDDVEVSLRSDGIVPAATFGAVSFRGVAADRGILEIGARTVVLLGSAAADECATSALESVLLGLDEAVCSNGAEMLVASAVVFSPAESSAKSWAMSLLASLAFDPPPTVISFTSCNTLLLAAFTTSILLVPGSFPLLGPSAFVCSVPSV